MTPHHAYRQHTAAGWTRIDLLLALYDQGIETADRARQAHAAGQAAELTRLRLRMQRVLLAILDGLDETRSEMPRRIQQLTLFILDRTSGDAREDWHAVVRILTTLREGFAGIRDEAAELESRGAIPRVDHVAPLNAIA